MPSPAQVPVCVSTHTNVHTPSCAVHRSSLGVGYAAAGSALVVAHSLSSCMLVDVAIRSQISLPRGCQHHARGDVMMFNTADRVSTVLESSRRPDADLVLPLASRSRILYPTLQLAAQDRTVRRVPDWHRSRRYFAMQCLDSTASASCPLTTTSPAFPTLSGQQSKRHTGCIPHSTKQSHPIYRTKASQAHPLPREPREKAEDRQR